MRREDGKPNRPLTYAEILSRLTPRQRQILEFFMDEPNEKRVAKRLGLTLRTIENQTTEMLHRLKVSSRAEMTLMVERAKLHVGEGTRPDGGAGTLDQRSEPGSHQG